MEDRRPGGSTPDRVKLVLLTALLVGVPGVILRASCVSGCDPAGAAPARVPFCSLPSALRAEIAAGFREGRSPDVVAVPSAMALTGSVLPSGRSELAGIWPSTTRPFDTTVPIVFSGTGVRSGAPVPDGIGLRQIAPTVARTLAFVRPFPDVRSGRAVPGVARPDRPRLVLEVVWKDVATSDLESHPTAWPTLDRLLATGTGTLRGDVGSLPVDAAAALTTIGAGGTPAEHGIVGTWLRNDRGAVVRAWDPSAPTSVIATLADDLDEALGQRPMIGLVGTDAADRGIIGRGWYGRGDRDAVVFSARRLDRLRAVERLVSEGFGHDPVPDVLAVVSEGPVRRLDRELRRVIRRAREASGGSLMIVVTATGSGEPAAARGLSAIDLVGRLERSDLTRERLVEAATPAGLFLDRHTLAREGVAGSATVRALLAMRGEDGDPLFADAFQGFAVSFGRYC